MAKQSFPAVLVVLYGLLSCATDAKYNKYHQRQINVPKVFEYYGLGVTLCQRTPGLSREQIKICERETETVKVALDSFNRASEECQFQFRHYRWNCSSLNKPKNLYTSAIFQRGFKETSFAYALSSAGVALSVASACARGNLRNCDCDIKKYDESRIVKEPSAQFKWSGCSENVNYGAGFARRFLDSREHSQDMYSVINMHNNRVGIKVVKNNMQLKCKCHGISGSCQMKTCWRVVPEFRLIGQILMEKYKDAIMVDQPNLSSSNPKKLLKKALKQKRRQKQIQQTKEYDPKLTKLKHKNLNLIYYEDSPTYCESDQLLGIFGTYGRYCNSSSHNQPDSCSTLCCGRGHDLIPDRRVTQCNCQFKWCCEVTCQICQNDWASVCK